MKHMHITITDTGEEIAREMTDEEYQALVESGMEPLNEAPNTDA
jgi:hypothetical protein